MTVCHKLAWTILYDRFQILQVNGSLEYASLEQNSWYNIKMLNFPPAQKYELIKLVCVKVW